MSKENSLDTGIRYEPDESPPGGLVLACGAQLSVLGITGLVLFPTIVVRAAGGTEAYLSWAVFWTVVVSGACTALQAVRLGRVGAGYVLWTGPAVAYIGVSVAALAAGGPLLLAALVIASSVVSILVSVRLSVFRRILTPTIVGTVNMLMPATVVPVVFGRLNEAPDHVPALGAPLTAAVTAAVIAGVSLKAAPRMRLWAPVLGVVAGSTVATAFGFYDVDRVARAPWFGLPEAAWPGIELDLGPFFPALLPAFLFVALVSALQTITSAVAVQRVSWRRPRAVDYRAVAGAVAADGAGKLLAGVAGVMPGQTSAISVPTTELTGVGARRVGMAAGALTMCVAFVPKALAVVLAVPGAVYGAYITVLLALAFVRGMTEVVQDGIDHRKALIAGVAFWFGAGCQNDMIFPELLESVGGGLLQNGMTAGGLLAILMTLFVEVTAPRAGRLEVEADLSALPEIREFVGEFAVRSGWGPKMVHRLDAVSEETLLTLVDPDPGGPGRRLFLWARKESGGALLEFAAAPGEENIQDRVGLLADRPDDALVEHEVSLRLLRHLASSVRHQQFHETDIVTVRVDAPGTKAGDR